jgi:hypothetical protein
VIQTSVANNLVVASFAIVGAEQRDRSDPNIISTYDTGPIFVASPFPSSDAHPRQDRQTSATQLDYFLGQSKKEKTSLPDARNQRE